MSHTTLAKQGGEYWLQLPDAGQTKLTPGRYYLMVVSEGRNLPDPGTIGSSAVSYRLKHLGEAPVGDLGTLPVAGEAAMAGAYDSGEVKLHRFTVPEGTLALEVRLEDRTGNPWLAVAKGEVAPNLGYYYYYWHECYGFSGGGSGQRSSNLITIPNPEPGVYSVAVVAAETLWLITQSYSTVLLSRLSSHRGEPTHSQVQQSWTWAKQALAWTVPSVLALLLAPTTWLQALLGLEYGSLTRWWWYLAPGILALSWSNVLIHHFTALGQVRVSFFSSVGSALLTMLGLAYAMDAGGVEGVALGWSLVLVLNAAAVGGYFLNRYRSYLWPPSG